MNHFRSTPCPRAQGVPVLEGPDVLDRLGQELDDLHHVSGAPVTARRPWLAVWAHALPAWVPWAVLVWGPGGRLDAAALLARRRAGEVVQMVGLGHGRNDRGHLPCRNPRVAELLARAVAAELDRLDMPWWLRVEQLPVDDPVAAGLIRLVPGARTIAGGRIPHVCRRAETDVEAYLSKGMRKQLRKARNRLATAGLEPVIHFEGDGTVICGGLLDEVERTHRSRDHAVGRSSDIDSPEGLGLWRGVIEEHARRGEVEIATLRFDAADAPLVAYVVSLLDGDRYRVLDGRFETEWAAFSPGRILESATIERMLADQRFSSLDWMNSVAPDKLVAADMVEDTVHLMISSDPTSQDDHREVISLRPPRPSAGLLQEQEHRDSDEPLESEEPREHRERAWA